MLNIAKQRSSDQEAERAVAILRAANDAFFDVDVANRRITWSRGVQLLFGHDPDRIGTDLGAWQRLVHPDDLDGLVASGREAVSEGTAWSDEFRFARADGTYAPVRARAFVIRRPDAPTHVVGSLADLGPLRMIEDELRETTAALTAEIAKERHERIRSELLMRAASSDVLGEWDLATGAIHWSPNFEQVMGYSPSELATIDAVAERIHPEDLDGSLGALRRVIEGQGPGWSGASRIRRSGGGYDEVEALAYVLRDEGGRATTVVGSFRPRPEGRGPSALRVPTLTSRQSEVLRLVRLGHTNKEIAGQLEISEQAAKVQVSKLLRKFGVHNRSALVAMADRLMRSEEG